MGTSWGGADPVAGLEKLAAELDSSVYAASIVTGSGGEPPYLKVTCRNAPILGERIFAQHGYFWWSWAERIAPVTDPATVAAAVARVLHTTEPQP
jgi:organic radical activating enzyme